MKRAVPFYLVTLLIFGLGILAILHLGSSLEKPAPPAPGTAAAPVAAAAGEIFAGIVLGPSLFGAFAPQAFTTLTQPLLSLAQRWARQPAVGVGAPGNPLISA